METKEIVDQMKSAGVTEIPDATSSAREIICAVTEKYNQKWFTQKDFQTAFKSQPGVGASGPYINGVLKKLVTAGTLLKEKRGRSAFYKHA